MDTSLIVIIVERKAKVSTYIGGVNGILGLLDRIMSTPQDLTRISATMI